MQQYLEPDTNNTIASPPRKTPRNDKLNLQEKVKNHWALSQKLWGPNDCSHLFDASGKNQISLFSPRLKWQFIVPRAGK